MIRSEKMKNIINKRMKRKKQQEINFELGCFMTVYNRPDLLIDSTATLLKCKDLTGIKFVICEDASTDPKINNIILDFGKKLTSKGNLVRFILHKNNYGKARYHKTLKECFKELKDCKYIMPIPPDYIFNPYLFQTARSCYKYMNESVRLISFCIDKRFENIVNRERIIDRYFTKTKLYDWGPAVIDGQFAQEFSKNISNMNAPGGTGTVHAVINTAQLKEYELYQYKESPCQHIGNNNSAMNPAYRKSHEITLTRVNLTSSPEIVMDEVAPEGSDYIEPVRSDNNRILVVKSCGIGNVICITPAIIRLKEIYPKSSIDLLVENESYAEILKGWDLIDDIYIDGDQMKMPEYRYIINGLPSRIPTDGITGQVYNGQAEWYKSQMHEVQANIKILDQIQPDERDIPVVSEIYIPEPKNKNELNKSFPGRKYIGISAGFAEGMEFKNWGYAKYASLIIKLLRKYKDHKILIFGIGKDRMVYENIIYIQLIKDSLSRIINCVDEYSIQETAYLIGKCEFMVANDTGLAHISAAVRTKCFTLFGMTPTRKALPWIYGIEVSLNLSCAEDCYYKKTWSDCEHKKCLSDMSVDFVYDRIIEKEKYDIGIMIATFDRPEFLSCTLQSILAAFDDPGVKIAFINDGSTDKRVNDALFEFSKVFKGKAVLLANNTNRGRLGYPYTLYRAFNQLYDCKYILTMPDDALINKHTYTAIKKSYEYFKDDIKCISYFRDGRSVNPYTDNEIEYFKVDPYDKYFDLSNGIDGFLCLFENKFLKNLNWKAPSTDGKTNFWRHIHSQLKEYKNLLYKESLLLHIGNLSSIMWRNKEGKRHLTIEGLNLNLFDEPGIMSGKAFEYSAEWYSEYYHKKGAYNLPKREYVELQNEWEKLGYKKRFYQVLNDAERFINFKDIKSICEAGCHHGKSVFWMREKYPDKKYDAFDFSKVAVDWCQKNNPYDNIEFKIGDVRKMPYNKKFDMVTCLDVGEHLPEDVYFEMIKELKRISSKYILWYVGRTVLEEHINLRSIEQQKKDLKELGSIVELPLYHLLIRRK